MKPKRSIVIVGASGQGDVLFDCAKEMDIEVVAFIDPQASKMSSKYSQISIHNDIHDIRNCQTYDYLLAIGDSAMRRSAFEKCRLVIPEDNFPRFIHPSATVSASAIIQPAAIVLRNVIIEPKAVLSIGCLVNNGSIISHGVNLGEFSSVGPSVTIAGNTTIGKTTTIGMGSNVIQNRNIGSNVMIGAGSTVITDIPNDQIAYGVPAKFADKKK